MWLCLNRGFLSIVAPTVADLVKARVLPVRHTATQQDESVYSHLVVRARVRAHLTTYFPRAQVWAWPGRDYPFRVFVTRQEVLDLMRRQVVELTATNFKDSVKDKPLHDAYLRVWGAMASLQDRFLPRRRRYKPEENTDYIGDDWWAGLDSKALDR